jgi:riboflavin kinase/FMN adenylyltransferase
VRPVVGPAVVALGNFDGVHLGHQVVVRRAVEKARSRGMRAVAVTFDPHPRSVLRPGSEPKLLTVLEVREELLLGCGVDEVRVLRFDLDLSKKSPGDFVREVLVGELGAGVVVVGENFRFGYKASGDVKDLDRHMRDAGGEAYAVPTYVLGEAAGSGEAINSTRIRMLLHDGEAREAARLLGRPYSLRGVVVEGDKRGHALGFPTANVLPGAVALVPGRGVYAGHVRVRRRRAYLREAGEQGRGLPAGLRWGSVRGGDRRYLRRAPATGEAVLGRVRTKGADSTRRRGGASRRREMSGY